MILVRFTDDGYSFIETNVVRFIEDKQHHLLFDYVSNKSLFQLPNLLEQYVIKKMDIASFKLNDYQYTETDSEAINKILTDLHPYYRYNTKTVFVKMIGNYLNALLLKSSYHEGQTPRSYSEYNRDWYVERFKALADHYLRFDDESPDSFYKEYRNYVGYSEEDEESFSFLPKHILNRPANECIDEIWTHESVARLLYWILDITVHNLKDLTVSQRVWLYANIFSTSTERSVIEHLSLTKPIRYNVGQDNTPQWEMCNRKEDIFEPLYGKLDKLHVNQSNNVPDTQAALNIAIEWARQLKSNEIYEEYEVTDLYQLLYLEILKMIKSNTTIRKCSHCERYFIVENLNVRYCSRIADGENKPCNIIGSKSTFDKKMKTDEALKLYHKAYKTHYARINGDTFTRDKFDRWKKEAKAKLGIVREGKLCISEFEKWLKK